MLFPTRARTPNASSSQKTTTDYRPHRTPQHAPATQSSPVHFSKTSDAADASATQKSGARPPAQRSPHATLRHSQRGRTSSTQNNQLELDHRATRVVDRKAAVARRPTDSSHRCTRYSD